MTELLDLATSYRVSALLFLLMSITTWLVLWRSRTAALRVWCLAGVAAFASIWLITLRGAIHDHWTYTLTQPLLFASYLLYAQALRMDMARGWSWRALAVVVLFYAWILWLGFEHRQSWSMGVVVRLANSASLLALTWSALSLARHERSRNSYFLVFGFALFTLGMLVNAVLTWLGHARLYAMQQSVMSHVLGGLSLLTMLMVYVGYLGLALERTQRLNKEWRQSQWQAQQWREQAQALILLDRQRTLAVLANSLGHGIVQPLTATRLNVQLAERMAPLASASGQTEVVDALLQQTMDGLQRSAVMVERIRGFLRPVPSSPATLTLQSVLQDAHDLLRQELMQRGIALRMRTPTQPVRVQAEALPLTQALVQVMRNAMDAVHGQPQKQITLDLSFASQKACIEVTDSGPGLPPTLLAQASVGAQPVVDRLNGLGLYMTQGILSQFSGQLQLDNLPGAGACVRLILPLVDAQAD